MANLISFHDVAKHKCKNDCWILIHGKVYDISTFMDEHPGGDNVLLAVTGKDASIDFEDVNHSKDAKELMKKYCIGDVDQSTVPVTQQYIPPWEKESTAAETTKEESGKKLLIYLIPLLILGVAFALRFYNNK
ncbi:Cytochrome B5 isoform C [Arabidopsis thaliana]|uniref:Cytochrome B5 isoform C n=3 Tax=Arabidopsis TaxID=3701 RepID=CYB5C_ARATH|nr:cytochrome B5 isoform C [Arabidopsis thaliana]Q9ZNV4.1 RecName: Full=Cytochrome B5 isoform C; Short=AtCb5-C [Arabidopsis thaliana]KAG7639954.1 Cytochrome b5-like heme/steroid binding domain [Arabidopsis thaliana x Arabidopsis arenosa]AAC69922.1 putative cytochrome b5 [Arabidopsis thaliana]AAM15242.1 putative cytochrome b5 [Arabidopsis thaliana]AAM65196.1 putative cytochrome b5 [Arabidopsis thaliana]ABF59018.1 At2g46650 [Arabidopsis thaliana]|eukprot:NP_182188.1 cytochrome B5 isoform C [Arabidopsis thaliana]